MVSVVSWMPGWRNTVLDAAKVALALEAWFHEFNKRNSAGLISPWGAISGVRGGWPHKPAFPTAAVELYVDVRVSAHSTPADAQRQFLIRLGVSVGQGFLFAPGLTPDELALRLSREHESLHA